MTKKKFENPFDVVEPCPSQWKAPTWWEVLRCRLFHLLYHREYWVEMTKRFYRCDKCGRHWAKDREHSKV